MKLRVWLFFSVLASSLLAQEDPAPPALRSPRGVTPKAYAITMRLDPNAEQFTGTVLIDLAIAQPTRVVWLNATGPKIDHASIETGGTTLTGRVLPGNEDFAGVIFPRDLAAGSARLRLAYHAPIDLKSSNGVFRGKDGGVNYIYTQFEPIDARRAYPCFDEPGYKVPWQLTLEVPASQMAITNTMAVKESPIDGGFRRVEFAATRPMPSYLVAFAVGPFEAVSAGVGGQKKIPIRIIAPKGRAAEAKYAAEVTAAVVNQLEEYFGIPFPFEKLDQLAVPLFGGAMEHPGLITYGDTLILSKPDRDTEGRQRGYTSVAAHELAHQWFGNLVTMLWWDDLWLNEGFATWMADKITARLHPEWKVEASRAGSRNGAMAQDSLVSARRVRQPIDSKNDIVNAFDGITYQKGGALLTMMESWVGEDKFRSGVTAYLKKHSWGNATSADFLQSIGASAGGTGLAEAFATFLDQNGVPEVSASLNCKSSPAKLVVSQKRSMPLGSASVGNQLWHIPICIEYPGADGQVARQCDLLKTSNGEISLRQASGCPAWVLPNEDMRGYYRVKLDAELLGKILDQRFDTMSLPARTGLINDLNALTRTGALPVTEAFQLLPRLAASPDRQVVNAGINMAAGASGMLEPEDRPRFERFLGKTFGPRARELGWTHRPGDTADTKFLRSNLVGFVAMSSRDEALGSEAGKLAGAWLEDHSSVPADLAGVILRTAATFGSESLHSRYVAALKQTKDPTDRELLVEGLGGFEDPALIRKNQQIALSPDYDLREVFGLLFGYPRNQRRMAFDFVRQNIDVIDKRLPSGIAGGSFGGALAFTAAPLCSTQDREEVKTFFQDRIQKYTGGPRTLANVLDGIGQCAARKDNQYPALKQFLAAY